MTIPVRIIISVPGSDDDEGSEKQMMIGKRGLLGDGKKFLPRRRDTEEADDDTSTIPLL